MSGQRPPINYNGSTVRLGPWIASVLPPHRCYVEPFFDSGAVLFAKPVSTHEIVSDRDATVANFLRVLRDRPRELARACVLTPSAGDGYTAAFLGGPGVDELERAGRFWARSVMSYNRRLNPRASWSSSAKRGSNDAVSAANISDRLLAVAERLRRVAIDNAPAVKVVAKYGVHGAVIYADPPHLGSARRSLERHRASDYACEHASEDDHRELAEALRATDAVVLLSGYASALYDEDLYPDWWRVERTVHRPSANRAGRGDSRAVEVIWSNRPIPAQLELGWAGGGAVPEDCEPEAVG